MVIVTFTGVNFVLFGQTVCLELILEYVPLVMIAGVVICVVVRLAHQNWKHVHFAGDK